MIKKLTCGNCDQTSSRLWSYLKGARCGRKTLANPHGSGRSVLHLKQIAFCKRLQILNRYNKICPARVVFMLPLKQ